MDQGIPYGYGYGHLKEYGHGHRHGHLKTYEIHANKGVESLITMVYHKITCINLSKSTQKVNIFTRGV